MTVIVLVISACIAAWAREVGEKHGDRCGLILPRTIELVFLALAIGAGIQFTFKG